MKSSTVSPSMKRTEPLPSGEVRSQPAEEPSLRTSLRERIQRWLGGRAVVPPGLHLPGNPRLLVLTGLVFVALCTVLAAWSGRTHPDFAGFDLHTGETSSNLDTSSAAPVPLAASRSLDSPENARPQATDTIAPEEKKSDQETLRGDDTMPRFTTIGSALVLAAAFSAQPLASAADDKPTDTKATELSEKLDKLNRAVEKFNDLPERLNRIERSLNSLDLLQRDVFFLRRELDQTEKIVDLLVQNNAVSQDEVKRLKKQNDDLLARLQKLEDQQNKMQDAVIRISATSKGTEERLTDLQNKMQDAVIRISATSKGTEERLSDLQKQVTNGTRVSAAPPLLPEGTTGTVKFLNTLARPISVVLNDRVYRDVLPGETRIADPVPTGTFTYEVLGVHPKVTSPVRAGEIVTVRVYPIP